MKKQFFSIVAIVAAAVLPAATALAMAVTPVVIDMKSLGRNSRSEISVNNTAAGDIPVAISVSEATIKDNGEVTTIAVDDQFVIYPAQALIKPGAIQRFRVQYVGDPEMSKGRTFIFSVAQQPVALPEGTSGIQILYNFEVVVSVSPDSAQPNMNVLNSTIENIDGNRRAAITLNNTGAAIGYLSGSRVKLEAKDTQGRVVWSKSIEPEEFTQIVGVGIVGSGATRRFVLPFDLPAGGDTITASIRYVGRR